LWVLLVPGLCWPEFRPRHDPERPPACLVDHPEGWPVCRRSRHPHQYADLAIERKQKAPPQLSQVSLPARTEIHSPLAPSSADALPQSHSVFAKLPACQGIPTRDVAARVPPLAHHQCRHPAATDPHVRGIAPFPEPEDFTASSLPCQGRCRGPVGLAPGDAKGSCGRFPTATKHGCASLRNPTSIAHRHHSVKCWGRRVAASVLRTARWRHHP